MAFFPLEKMSVLHDGYQKAFKVGRYELLLLQMDGEVYIIENRCPHMDVALTQAVQVANKNLRCRAHGIEFSLVSGKACGPLANQLDCLIKFPVVYDLGSAGVDIDA